MSDGRAPALHKKRTAGDSSLFQRSGPAQAEPTPAQEDGAAVQLLPAAGGAERRDAAPDDTTEVLSHWADSGPGEAPAASPGPGTVQLKLGEKELITDATSDATLAGGSKFREGGSSLKPLIQALRRYRKNPSSANLKAIAVARAQVPGAKELKYTAALSNLDLRIASEQKSADKRKGVLVSEDVDGEEESVHEGILIREIDSLSASEDDMVPAKPPDFQTEHHTKTLDEVAEATGAKQAHDAGVTGAGVHVAIVDSGYFPHPYFKEKYPKAKIDVVRLPAPRYEGDIKPVQPEGKEGEDLNGHGTAMVANVLAMAPDAKITMIVCKSDMTALKYALSLGPDVISVSRGPTWGLGKGASNDPKARSELLDDYKGILDTGKKDLEREPIVLDAVGNKGAKGMLSLLPDVISVGGTHMSEKGDLAATSYTNAYEVPEDIYLSPEQRGKKGGGTDNIITKTQLPDITGLCGTEKHPDYLALPTQPGSELERKGTPGWGLASGSSCATPQVAGACALLKQVNPKLTAAEALFILRKTSTKVTEGRGFGDDGLEADGDWSRLINVEAAVKMARG